MQQENCIASKMGTHTPYCSGVLALINQRVKLSIHSMDEVELILKFKLIVRDDSSLIEKM